MHKPSWKSLLVSMSLTEDDSVQLVHAEAYVSLERLATPYTVVLEKNWHKYKILWLLLLDKTDRQTLR